MGNGEAKNLSQRQLESGRYVIENGWIVKKRCGGCKEMKAVSEYHTAKQNRDGYNHHCILCREKAYHKKREEQGLESRKSHREQFFTYDRKGNPIKRKCTRCYQIKSVKEFYSEKEGVHGIMSKCKKCISKYHAGRYEKDVEKIRKRQIETFKATYGNDEWKRKNPEKVDRALKRHRDYARKRLSTPMGKLNHSMSRSIWMSLRRNKNGWHWEDLVGYTLKDLKQRLQKQFQPGMTWENYGEWEIDHIRPLSKFNFSKPEHPDFRRAWGLGNLQPLWMPENRSKKDKVLEPFQISLALEVSNV